MEIYISSNFLDSKDIFDSINILRLNGFRNIELTGGKKYEKDIFNKLYILLIILNSIYKKTTQKGGFY